MSIYFVPYTGNLPAAIEIKGHRLLIVSTALEDMEHDLRAVGGEEVRELAFSGNKPEALADLAATVQGGVVIAPPGVSPAVMIENLEAELPWVH